VNEASPGSKRSIDGVSVQQTTGNLPGQAGEGFLIFFRGLLDDFGRESRRGRGFIPVEGLQVVANELFVVAERTDADLVRVGRPET